jgi:hypothetical protein
MHKIAAAAAVLVALVTVGTAGASLRVGVAEDTNAYSDGGAAIYSSMRGVGMTAVRATVLWDETKPTEVRGLDVLTRSVDAAVASGLEVSMAISPIKANAVTATPNGTEQFAQYCLRIAQAFPKVKTLIIGNEPNQPRFWQPQFDSQGHFASGAAYERLLARTYDLLKGYDSSIRVVGIPLSPRGGDDPNKPNHIDTSPVHFIHDVGAAYRASARKAPLMDEMGFHPYPNPNRTDDPPAKGYQWPNAGLFQLPRLQQAVWDAFHGTGQPTFLETGLAVKGNQGALKWALDETAYQVAPQAGIPGYTGTESNQMVSEATQAKYYGEIVALYECDARVSSLLFFKWVDETRLEGYQSGFENILGTLRPVAGTVRSAINAGCAGKQATWKHTNGVVGASANFHPGGGAAFTATAGEHFTYTAGVYRLGGKSAQGTAAAKGDGTSRAYWTLELRLPSKRLSHGTYVYRITMHAAMNPARVSVFTSRPFTR